MAEVGSHSVSDGEWNDSVGVCLPPAVVKKGSEPLVVLTKDLPEQIVQKTGLEKDPAPASGAKLKAGKVRSQFVVHGACGFVGKVFLGRGRTGLSDIITEMPAGREREVQNLAACKMQAASWKAWLAEGIAAPVRSRASAGTLGQPIGRHCSGTPQPERGGRLWTVAVPGRLSQAAEGRLEAAQSTAGRSVPGRVPDGGSHGAADGAASSVMAEATDLGEKMVRQRETR
ncbi:hypothetical protein QYF61_021311 [Mycteria americana]|uniref:Uncharacterized protein n=1 Tax=Mycteria americana TaxID=33587 RepID=A0AAN7RV04_MYCAM|nr:hypothetical protein QYF61_021311 [Mycteria americana]